ncbi:hypothetical protein B0H14DRAFT_3157041 [Mycena olivaceomarginata]|nr:hypothetical protein B0H14DRAFT_3157041 [Mycena olivaceomarginata]
MAGSELADEAAKAATRCDPDPSLFVSLTTVRRLIEFRVLALWDKTWSASKTGDALLRVDRSSPSHRLTPLYTSDLPHGTSATISQLRMGPSHLNAYCFKSGFIASPACDACGAARETRSHYLLECPRPRTPSSTTTCCVQSSRDVRTSKRGNTKNEAAKNTAQTVADGGGQNVSRLRGKLSLRHAIIGLIHYLDPATIPEFLESEVAKGLELQLPSSDEHSTASTGHTPAEAPGTHSTAFEDAQQAGERTLAYILENICTPRTLRLGRRDQLSGFCKIERKLTESPLCAGFRSALIIRYGNDNAVPHVLPGFELSFLTGHPSLKIPTVDDGLRRRLRDSQRDQAQAPAPRIVFGCLPTTHVIAGPPFSGTRWDTLVLDAAGFSLSPAPGTTNEWIDKVPAGRRHADTRRSARLRRRVARRQYAGTTSVLISGCKQFLTVAQLLLSHLRKSFTVTQTVGSMDNGRVLPLPSDLHRVRHARSAHGSSVERRMGGRGAAGAVGNVAGEGLARVRRMRSVQALKLWTAVFMWMCTPYSVEKFSAYSIARVAYAHTRARNGCRHPLRGIFPLRVRDDLALKTAALPFLGSRSCALRKRRRCGYTEVRVDELCRDAEGRRGGRDTIGRREWSQHGRGAERGAGDGEGLPHVVRAPLVMRIGLVVCDKRKRGSAGVRIPRERRSMGPWSRMAPTEDVAASAEATSGTPARRNGRGGRWSCTPGWGCTEAQPRECDGDDKGARRGCTTPVRGAARGRPGVGEEESGAVPEMVAAGVWRGKQRMRWGMDAAGPTLGSGVEYPAAVRRGLSLTRATRASRNDSAAYLWCAEVRGARLGRMLLRFGGEWIVVRLGQARAHLRQCGGVCLVVASLSPALSTYVVLILSLISTLDFWQQLESIMLSRDDSRSLHITGGQGGHGGHGHSHGTGGPGGTGSGPNVNIIEHQSIVYNLHPGPASQQAFQPSNIQASQTINHCPPPSRIFQGRRDILDKMHSFFTSDVGIQHIYVLYGLGGAGKTQITLKFVNESSSRFSDTFFIDASTITTIDTGLKNIAVVKGSGDSLQDGLLWLASRTEEWLLVFDNTDDPSINLNDFIPQCNHGNIIITSRNPGLRVYGSHSPVSDMEEEDAVALLLKSAAQAVTTGTMPTATEIVKALHYLPLAIVQAGSFISKSQDLDGYLTLYTKNQARLLGEMPAQTHDHYARTVYTTWQMSFDQLTQPAAMFLQYCSFLHHNGISEQIFSYASQYTFPSNGPSEEDLWEPLEFLSHFVGPSGKWDSLQFSNMTNEVQAYSLISIDAEKKLFSIHPLVHAWSQATGNPEKYSSNMGSILGMALSMDAEVALVFKEQYGLILWEAGKYKQYEKLLEGVLEEQKQILGDNHPDTLCTIGSLASTYSDLGEHQKAKELNLTVLEKCKQVLGDNHPHTLRTMGSLARTHSDLGEHQKSKELYLLVLEGCKQVLDLGEHQKAKELNLTVLEKRKQVLGDNHPHTLDIIGNLANTYSNLGEHQKAKELNLTVLEKKKQVLGDNHPDTLRTMGNLAWTYSDLGEHQKAKELSLTVLEKQKQQSGLDILRAGRASKAKELNLPVLEKQKQVLGDNHPDTLHTMGNLARTYSCLGEHQKAKELKATVLEKQNQLLPTHSPSLHVSAPSPPPLQLSHAPSSLSPLRKLGRWLKKQTAAAAAESAPAGETKATQKYALQDNTRLHQH